MEKLFSYIESIRHITADLKSGITNIFKPEDNAKGSILLREGQINDCIWFLHRGMVRWYAQKNGRKITNWFNTTGEFIFEPFSFNERIPSQITIEALEDCVTSRACYKDVLALRNAYPDFQDILVYITNRHVKAVADHSGALLLTNATERYLYLLKQNGHLLERVPAKYLASFINIDLSSFYRVKAKNQRKEIL